MRLQHMRKNICKGVSRQKLATEHGLISQIDLDLWESNLDRPSSQEPYNRLVGALSKFCSWDKTKIDRFFQRSLEDQYVVAETILERDLFKRNLKESMRLLSQISAMTPEQDEMSAESGISSRKLTSLLGTVVSQMEQLSCDRRILSQLNPWLTVCQDIAPLEEGATLLTHLNLWVYFQ